VLAAGGDLLNDMSALPDDRNVKICVETGAALLIMHSIGLPKVPHTHVGYTDVIAEMTEFFREKIAMARAAGLRDEAIVLDPGIDFAKQAADNLRIYRELEFLHEFQRPIMLPVSRKSVIGRTLGIKEPTERDAATAACIVSGILRGAHIFRVHNVEMAWKTIVTTHRIMQPA
jgi:dihydropteroate synthase